MTTPVNGITSTLPIPARTDSPALDAPVVIPDAFEAIADDAAKAERTREEARQAYTKSVTDGEPLSGKALGEQYGRSERWGRDRIAEAKTTLPPVRRTTAAVRKTGTRTAPGTDRRPATTGSTNGTAGSDGSTAVATPAAPEQVPVPAAATTEATVPLVPAGGRAVAWIGFVFGSVMSVAANVLHTWLPAAAMPAGWSPGIAPQIGAAVWPIGLLLSVEVLSRVAWQPGWRWGLARYGGAGTVSLGSAVISYGHLRDVLAAWQYGPLAAHVGPLVLDGLMVISGFALLAMSARHTTKGDQR